MLIGRPIRPFICRTDAASQQFFLANAQSGIPIEAEQQMTQSYSTSPTKLHNFRRHVTHVYKIGILQPNFNHLWLCTLCMVCPSHLVIPATVTETFHSEWRGVWIYRAGALLFPYSSFPEKASLNKQPSTFLIATYPFFCRKASYCT